MLKLFLLVQNRRNNTFKGVIKFTCVSDRTLNPASRVLSVHIKGGSSVLCVAEYFDEENI